jgi:hypothetical protein
VCADAGSSQADPFRTSSMSPVPGLPRVRRGASNRAIENALITRPNEAAIAKTGRRGRSALEMRGLYRSTPNDGRPVDSKLRIPRRFSTNSGVPAEWDGCVL